MDMVIMIIFGGKGKHAMGPQFVNECIAFALLCRSAEMSCEFA